MVKRASPSQRAAPLGPWAQLAGSIAGAAAIALIGLADYLTGERILLSPFYVVPVVLAGWVLGRFPAVALAVFSTVSWVVAEELVLEPTTPAALIWNVATRLAVFSALGYLTAVVRSDRRRLRELLARETEYARTDALTGLANARAFHDLIELEFARSVRTNRPLCLAAIDLDNFKRVNDLHGHAAGDELLVAVADCFRRCVRATDVPVRQGGDEFAILFFEVELAQAEEVVGRLIEEIRGLGMKFPDCAPGASAGIAYWRRPPADVDEMLRRADAAMYRAKAAGKGRVRVDVFE